MVKFHYFTNYYGLRSLLFIFTLIYPSDFRSENDNGERLNNDFDETVTKLTATKQFSETTFQVPDEKWTSASLKDIAYYLRNYKFNEWDQRYYSTRPDEDLVGFYDSFPIPILRSLHWKVYENCNYSFYKCITYLQSVIDRVPFGRHDDVVTFMNDKAMENGTLNKMNDECEVAKLNSERSSFPFDSLKEKFQWRTTASYYMCWYTILGTPALSMLGEICDNFANCLDPKFGHRNHDVRSDDKLSFACAMYSFCPDPCCPLKHVVHVNRCIENILNPCFDGNRGTQPHTKCTLDRKENINLNDIITNKWNVSCTCKQNGFIWKSQFGLCVDFNECLAEQGPCDNSTEDCLNTPGSYECICKWGFELDNKTNQCVQSNFNMTFDNDVIPDYNYTSIINIITKLLRYIGIKI